MISANARKKPKPLALQIAEGDRSKRGRLKLASKSIPQPMRGLPACPPHLRGRARAAWNLLRNELEAMDLDATADAMLLEALCVNYQTHVKASLKIAQQGEVIKDAILSRDTGQIIGHRSKKNPWLAIREHAHRLLLSFFSEFAISPAARSRLNVPAPAHDDGCGSRPLRTETDGRRETENAVTKMDAQARCLRAHHRAEKAAPKTPDRTMSRIHSKHHPNPPSSA